MALQIKGLEREFRFKHNGQDITLPDPDPERNLKQVMQLLSNQYSELTTASVNGPTVVNDKAVYEFKTTFGTKG